MKPLLPGAPMPDENPSTDFFLYMKKKGFTASKPSPKTNIEVKKMMPLAMHTPRYHFRVETPSVAPPAISLSTPKENHNKTLIFLRVLLLSILAVQGYGIYYLVRKIDNDSRQSAQPPPHDLTTLRDILIASEGLVGFALVVSFFF